MPHHIRRTIITLTAALACAATANANPSMLNNFNYNKPGFEHPHPFATSRIVIQIDSNNPETWSLALNNAANAMNLIGSNQTQIVIVAFGPGLHMLLANSPVADRITVLDKSGVEFDACNNTIQAMAHALGHTPKLLPQAVIVPAGIVRITQLEAHGFSYIKP